MCIYQHATFHQNLTQICRHMNKRTYQTLPWHKMYWYLSSYSKTTDMSSMHKVPRCLAAGIHIHSTSQRSSWRWQRHWTALHHRSLLCLPTLCPAGTQWDGRLSYEMEWHVGWWSDQVLCLQLWTACPYIQTHNIHTDDIPNCVVPRTLSSYSDRTFAAAELRLWNSLLVQLHHPHITYGLFRQQLKQHFFGKHEHSALSLMICSALEKHILTYLQNTTY